MESKAFVESADYIGFRGVYVPQSGLYYLCDFDRYKDCNGELIIRVAAQVGAKGKCVTIHLRHDTTTRTWRILEEGVEEGLISKLLETTAGLVK